MKRLFLFFLISSITVSAQSRRPEVLTLGTFHFNFPNLDAQQVGEADKIDVLQPKYQREIESIVQKVAAFKPTIIVIERPPSRQHQTDSLLTEYLQGTYQLRRHEEEQIGFRLAKQFGLKTLYCVDEWGVFTNRLDSIVFGKDSAAAADFEAFYNSNPERSLQFNPPPVFKSKGILAALRQANNEQHIRKSMGNYLVGLFKYEAQPHDFTGADFETGRWFNRNLRIFRNIQRIPTTPNDRILVIYGAGHMNLLNYFFDCSPEFHRKLTNAYLR